MFKSDLILIGAKVGTGTGVGFLNRPYSSSSKKGNSIRLTNAQKESFFISQNLHDIIIGLILGDLFVSRDAKNARLRFKQSLDHKDYIDHLFNLFSYYSNMKEPKEHKYFDNRTNKFYYFVVFNTFSLPCLNYYHDLFYVNGVKIIPLNIEELLTPTGLAYWAMDDGTKLASGFMLATNSFTLVEVELLAKALKNKFNLNTSIYANKKGHISLYIRTASMENFRNLVSPYFHDSMKYKLR